MHSGTYPWYSQTFVFAATSVLVLFLDLLIAPFIAFPIAFLLPLSIMAWCYTLRATIVLATVLMISRLANRMLWLAAASHPIRYELVNNGVDLVVVIAVIYLVAQIAEQRRVLQIRLSLPELIPICAYCKKIRRDDSQWEEVETYITRQTQSTFSHGICPECIEVQRVELQRTKRQL